MQSEYELKVMNKTFNQIMDLMDMASLLLLHRVSLFSLVVDVVLQYSERLKALDKFRFPCILLMSESNESCIRFNVIIKNHVQKGESNSKHYK